MKKRTKIFCGVAILIAIVSMNIRHAWMNYGIAKDKILVGVVADSMDVEEDVTCSSKSGYLVAVKNKKDLKDYLPPVKCVVATTVEYFKVVNGSEKTLATEITDLATGQTTVVFSGSPFYYKSLKCKIGDPIETKFTPMRIICDEGEYKGSCCYPKKALSECSDLIRATT